METDTPARGPQYLEQDTNPPPLAPSPAEPNAPDPQLVNKANQILAKFLADNDYHPVLLCGTAAAGKTTMLASLCAFLSTCGTAAFDFGEWFDPGDSSDAREQLEEAQRFFRDMVYQFRDGTAPDATHFPLPYIIPLKVTPINVNTMPRGADGRPRAAKLAVMDMRGEFFKPDQTAAVHRPMHADTEALLRAFERGVSMVYLAPFTRVDGYNNHAAQMEPHEGPIQPQIRFIEDPDEALRNAIKRYENVRTTRGIDRHLFMLTKWDLRTKGTEAPGFLMPEQSEIEAILERKFATSWSAFRALRTSAQSKWFVQYSAGIISGREVTRQHGESRRRLERYSKVLWNWLYEGAVGGDQQRSVRLFPDVAPRPAPWFEKLLTGRSMH